MPAVVRPLLAGTVVTALGYWAAFGPRSQVFGRFPYRAEPAEQPGEQPGEQPRHRRVALTFDDGPNEPWTSRLLDTLAALGVPATFFQVGRCVERHPDVTRRVVAEGHMLGNHSYSHAFRRYATQPRQRDEIRRGPAVLAETAGVEPLLYRPPWLCHLPWVLSSIAASGATPVSGTFGHLLEVRQPPSATISSATLARTRPGSIMIMHDGREARGGPRRQTVEAVGPLVDALRQRDYDFVTVDQLLQVPAYA